MEPPKPLLLPKIAPHLFPPRPKDLKVLNAGTRRIRFRTLMGPSTSSLPRLDSYFYSLCIWSPVELARHRRAIEHVVAQVQAEWAVKYPKFLAVEQAKTSAVAQERASSDVCDPSPLQYGEDDTPYNPGVPPYSSATVAQEKASSDVYPTPLQYGEDDTPYNPAAPPYSETQIVDTVTMGVLLFLVSNAGIINKIVDQLFGLVRKFFGP
ncbi:hypothetical protein C8J57DRAFT_1535859 [Mycena rebaudengoi]|nr:hypothetical protein C8J57DRAFT_1535859 [Mycena rebaudengoi]